MPYYFPRCAAFVFLGGDNLSLIYSQITKKTAIVAADTRAVDTLPDGTEIILNDNSLKLVIGDNFIIGFSGEGQAISNALNELLFTKDSDGFSNFSPDRVSSVLKKHHEEYIKRCKQQGKELVKDSNTGTILSLAITIIGVKNDKIMRYSYLPQDNGEFGVSIDSVADEDVDGRQLISLFGCTSPEMDQWGLKNKDIMGSLDFIRALYSEFESAHIGGYLTVFKLSVDNGVENILIESIPTKGGYVYKGDYAKC